MHSWTGGETVQSNNTNRIGEVIDVYASSIPGVRWLLIAWDVGTVGRVLDRFVTVWQ